MRKVYKKIEEILKKTDTGSKQLNLTLHLSKLFEEAGEVAQEINKLNGRKKTTIGETLEDIDDNICEEVADAIQCLMAIAITAGVDYERLKDTLVDKNVKFEATGVNNLI